MDPPYPTIPSMFKVSPLSSSLAPFSSTHPSYVIPTPLALVKYDQALKKLEALALCSMKIWMTIDKPRTAEVD